MLIGDQALFEYYISDQRLFAVQLLHRQCYSTFYEDNVGVRRTGGVVSMCYFSIFTTRLISSSERLVAMTLAVSSPDVPFFDLLG